MNKEISKKKIFIAAGAFFVLVALILLTIDLYRVIRYDHVDATVSIVRNSGNSKQAMVTYSHGDFLYLDVKLSGYNAITMRDGKSMKVLINPKKPDKPYTTSFIIEGLAFACGFFGIFVGFKTGEEIKSETYGNKVNTLQNQQVSNKKPAKKKKK
ncbi:MAG: hypothetical protein IKR27_03525 [Lachnospiraceae bacterium]|nr:hypothetical protein [Lachnospiraceae bacterium]